MIVNFSDYQMGTRTTDTYPRDHALALKSLGLAGEAGEVANKVKKVFRDDGGVVSMERALQLEDELGDVLWYVAQVADELHLDLSQIAHKNLSKLASRKERGALAGSGDAR
jgi:NTP pyrophosphatase (non-canonical NTP hydrolase)